MDKANILIVDDSSENLKKLQTILKSDYIVKVAKNGEEALNIIQKNSKIDIILSDISMPKMDGYKLCKYVKSKKKYRDIPFIFITSSHDNEDEKKGFKLGAADFITKPFAATKVLARVHAHVSLYKNTITLNETIAELDTYKNNLEEKVQEGLVEINNLNEEILATQCEVIFTMGAIGESRSKETGDHVKRVAEYSHTLGKLYGLTNEECELLKIASPMHDIGKIAIPDDILNKPGKHTEEESKIMKKHAKLGYSMLKHSKKELFKAAAIIANQHHEKWDGTGYPQGLKGKDIHIFGRITAVADVFDALGHDRCYKKAWEDEKIFKLFQEESGKHFDPKLVEIFFKNLDEFLEIRLKWERERKKFCVSHHL